MIIIAALLKDFLTFSARVVFCDVGQGDAAYIRTKDRLDVLVDAGPDRKVLNCLGKYMPFYDRKIELAFLSHPQKDHYGGYLYLFDRYKIDNLIISSVQSQTDSFLQLKEKLIEKKIKSRFFYAGDKISTRNLTIEFFWPEKTFVQAKKEKDLNNFSQVFILSVEKSKILFTGDATGLVLEQVEESLLQRSLDPINILKVPHHGSKNGLTFSFLKLADPITSVISVGKNNPYSHPSKEVLGMFKALKKQYIRTDEKGQIVFKINNGRLRFE